MMTGHVQSYSTKSMKVILILIFINVFTFYLWVIWKEKWVRLICEVIYNMSCFNICPAALIWLNDKYKNYLKKCIFGPGYDQNSNIYRV